ncbi:hypothetical protein GCM10011507_33510 [Edaphobacter acidisoli]|uniref:Uncharacterized protein n=1 Tax=Edaphobacter acidisoli TaxID=2040573 RepID=A0A916WA59_9BACT|nr:hypothetical protein GCM10011507_33510 [Edaphobacter acidisoli]
MEWNYLDSVARVRSVFTGQSQTQQWFGADMLGGTAELPPLTVAQADDWEAFLMQLRGSALAFQLSDPLRPTIRGSGAGSPMVDNTQPGGNAAGSQMLATKGWTANAVNVLRRGDWIEVQYRMYRVLDDVTADSNGNAIIPIWPSLREQPAATGTSARWLNAAGSITRTSTSSLGSQVSWALWSNFALPSNTPLPPDAVIQGIYPVIIASGVKDGCDQFLGYGPGINWNTLGGGMAGASWFSQPYGNPGSGPSPAASFSSTEFYSTSIGTLLSVLNGQEIAVSINSSLNQTGLTDSMTVTGVGFAVYYTSATPATDTLMPAPFTVPGGQGVAWALPSTTSVSVSDGSGTATATPGIDNGGLTLNGAKGLFRLAQNKRSSSADITLLSKLSFAFEEYR